MDAIITPLEAIEKGAALELCANTRETSGMVSDVPEPALTLPALQLAANLSFMFQEWDFLDRFQAAADAGFKAVEVLFPYDYPADAIAARLASAKLRLVLFNTPPGDWAKGERGFACLSGGLAQVKAGIAQALPYAKACDVRQVHALSGNGDPGDPLAAARWHDAMRIAAETLARQNMDLLVEPLNPVDAPGYFLRDFGQAAKALAALNAPNVRLQFDIYHRQMIHGNVAAGIAELAPLIGHVQIAGVPGRQEPDFGELNYSFIFAALQQADYRGHVGCEYRPRNGTLAGLGWARPYLDAAQTS